MIKSSDGSKVFVRISDEDVLHIWKCNKCKTDAQVDPSFYGTAGTPFCADCNDDMVYVQTMVSVVGDGKKSSK